MPAVETYNTGLTEEQLTSAFNRALNDYTDAQVDGKILAAVTGLGLTVRALAPDDADNPTAGTSTETGGILLSAASAENSGVGLNIFASTAGEIYARTKSDSSTWNQWAEISTVVFP